MKHLLISAAALALLAGSAQAQQNTAPSNAPAPAQTAPTNTPPPPPAELAPDNNSDGSQSGQTGADSSPYSRSQSTRPASSDEGDDQEEMDGREEMREQRGDRRFQHMRSKWDRDRPHWRQGQGARHGMRPHHMRRGDGARFQIEWGADGEMKVDVRCPSRVSFEACADVTNNLLDRLSSGDEMNNDN